MLGRLARLGARPFLGALSSVAGRAKVCHDACEAPKIIVGSNLDKHHSGNQDEEIYINTLNGMAVIRMQQ